MAETPRGTLYPVLPLRDIVVFPHMIVPLFVGREKSVRALEDVMKDDKQILLVAQKDAAKDDPASGDIFSVGTIGTVLQLLKLPDGTVKVLVEGGSRARILRYADNPNFFQAHAEILPERVAEPSELEALTRTVVSQFEQYIKLNRKIPPEVLVSVNQIDDPGKLADTVASHLALKIPEKQELLETDSVAQRLERIFGFMENEIGVLQVEKRIRNRVKRQMEKTQREYYLNEQLKAIQKELGEIDEGKDEASELEDRIKKTKLSKEAHDKAMAELKKLKTMSPMSAEATVVRNYLDWMLNIPWKKRTKVKKDVKHAEAVLNADHYGLEKVKERILEYLAVQQRSQKLRGPILCLVGPPGARQGHPGHEEGQVVEPALPARRDRQARRRLARRPDLGAARGAGPGAERHVQRPLPRGRLRPLGRDVHHDGEQPAHAAAAARPHGDHPDPRLHRGREGRDRQAPPDPEADGSARPQGGRVGDRGRGPARPHPLLLPRGRRPQPRA